MTEKQKPLTAKIIVRTEVEGIVKASGLTLQAAAALAGVEYNDLRSWVYGFKRASEDQVGALKSALSGHGTLKA